MDRAHGATLHCEIYTLNVIYHLPQAVGDMLQPDKKGWGAGCEQINC